MKKCSDNPIDWTEADFDHALACVNGCAGLNPAAHREVVEALTLLRGKMKSGWMDHPEIERTLGQVDQALAHAQFEVPLAGL